MEQFGWPSGICEFLPKNSQFPPLPPYLDPNYRAPCLTCMINQGINPYPQVNPWYLPTAQQYYYNYSSPGAYFSPPYGIQSNAYYNNPPQFPSPGVMMGKPVVYFDGPDHTMVLLTLEEKTAHSEIMATVPKTQALTWKAELIGGRLKTDEGVYDNFFYDALLSDDTFQDVQGHCGAREEIFEYMKTGLVARGFPQAAILDFETTWSIKLPHQQTLCAFPQSEKEIQKSLPLRLSNSNAILTQLEFVVIPTQYFKSRESKARPNFKREPTQPYVFAPPLSDRAPAAKQLHAYDWGVGFLKI